MYCLKTVVKLCFCGAAIVGLMVSSADAETLLVSSMGYDKVLMYDANTGDFQGVFTQASDFTSPDSRGGTAMNEPTGIDIGPDGNVYVGYRDTLSTGGGIFRYSPDGTFLGEFCMSISTVGDVKFGPDGNLYVTRTSRKAYRVFGPNHPNAGQEDTTFQPYYLTTATEGLAFLDHGDGTFDYFVSLIDSATVERRSSVDDSLIKTYTRPTVIGEGEDAVEDLYNYGITIGPDGRLYLGSGKNIWVADLNDSVMTIFSDSAAATDGLSLVKGMMFDDDGNLLANSYYRGTIEKFSGVDGSYLGKFAAPWKNAPDYLWYPNFGLVTLPVPEPSTLALLACGLASLLVWRRR